MSENIRNFQILDLLDFGQLRCLLEFEQTSEMRNSQGTRGTRETPGFLQAAPLRCFFFLPPFYIAGPPKEPATSGEPRHFMGLAQTGATPLELNRPFSVGIWPTPPFFWRMPNAAWRSHALSPPDASARGREDFFLARCDFVLKSVLLSHR